MAVCTSRFCSFFVSALLFAVAPFSAEGAHVITVAADHDCGETHYFGGMMDTYRIITSQDQTCPNGTYFECTVKFRYLDSYRTRNSRLLICVDFARIRLTGASTKLDVAAGSSVPYALTSLRYPVKNKYMSTIRCYNYYETVKLTFSAECDTSDLPLRHYFASWIYVYNQLSSTEPVYHIDGTCKLEGKLNRNTEMTIRSFIWQDTVAEPDIQKCSLVVKSYAYGIHDTYLFCPKWNFEQFSCGVSAYYRGIYILDRFDYSESENVTCYTGPRNMDACAPVELVRNVVIEVWRNESVKDNYTVQDGALFFEIKAHRKVERKTYDHGIKSVDSVDSVNIIESETAYSDDDDISIFWTFVVPSFVLFICCTGCVCTICSKKSKRQQPQNGAGTGEDAERNVGTAPPGTGTAMEPLVSSQRSPAAPSQQSSTLHTNDDTRGGVSGNDRFVAPPPAYVDVAFGPRSPGNRSSITSPSAPSQTTEDSSDYSAPPPPVLDAIPAAPPSYHELFPSND